MEKKLSLLLMLTGFSLFLATASIMTNVYLLKKIESSIPPHPNDGALETLRYDIDNVYSEVGGILYEVDEIKRGLDDAQHSLNYLEDVSANIEAMVIDIHD